MHRKHLSTMLFCPPAIKSFHLSMSRALACASNFNRIVISIWFNRAGATLAKMSAKCIGWYTSHSGTWPVDRIHLCTWVVDMIHPMYQTGGYNTSLHKQYLTSWGSSTLIYDTTYWVGAMYASWHVHTDLFPKSSHNMCAGQTEFLFYSLHSLILICSSLILQTFCI
jgi:hypothetical protein